MAGQIPQNFREFRHAQSAGRLAQRRFLQFGAGPFIAIALWLVVRAFPIGGAGSELERAAAALKSNDYPLALERFSPLADRGDTRAQFALGVLYSGGKGLPADHAKAAKLFEQSARSGMKEAQQNIGLAYLHGRGVSKDEAKARQWFQKAAAQGVPEAQNNLGALMHAGLGGSQQIDAARTWFLKGANVGFVNSQLSLGLSHLGMHGAPVDRGGFTSSDRFLFGISGSA